MSEITTFLNKAKDTFKGLQNTVYVIITYTDSFEVIKYSDLSDAKIKEEKLLDIRIFNESAEIRMYRDYCGNTFYPIVEIVDSRMQDKFEYYDDYQYIDIDTKRSVKNSDGKVRATGGGWYRFPFSGKDIEGIKLQIRNYVAFDQNGQAYIKAWRLVSFCNNKGEVITNG